MINSFYIVLQAQSPVSTAAERYLLVYMLGVLLIVCTLIILFFIVFQKRKNKLLLDKMKQQKIFDEEISRTQTEIQEQTLKNIGWELHDNVGQLLSVASMQLSVLGTQVNSDIKDNIKETTDIVRASLKEVRSLSKSLNNEVILNIGFEKSITNELDRLKRMKFTTAELHVKGNTIAIVNKKHEIIMFRILQEFLSNSVKYSEAKNLKVLLDYENNNLMIQASDDGKGFNVETAEKGSGLLNMKSRAALIKATFNLSSEINKGVTLTINYPLNQ
ncbi:histidine kinase [Oceanihabitans sp. 2_MG-2023]|uniref:sensor histidine kinase n=1 Tax=Oceanihabitans sp. 2_MG-2023 TaxID=3062661 RepID=UPI0026E454AE|nr:histidine kinase [Oceanihabitans sp. 2_MG-2023]MDO6597331.1 histidine kinase [Oceanihabitans sp. 2_MG-2023]